MNNRHYWLGFSLIPGIGPKRIVDLLHYFGDLSQAWTATEKQLLEAGLGTKTTANLLRLRPELHLDAEMVKVERAGAWLLTLADGDYPSPLKELPDAPPVLYVRGNLTPADDFALGVVGTRNATTYGRDAAYELSRQLAANSLTVISGLALGIDTAAHKAALDAGGRTIAVSGCGIERVYPAQNQGLAERIVENGALISEFPVGTPPEGHNFPIRNRIISGLALGVLVVEAPENSGAIITATTAAEQGREVFAVPSSLFNVMGRGTNRLIQDGAKLVMGVGDILDELNIAHENTQTRRHTEQIAPASGLETTLLQHLGADPIHIDELVRLCQLPISTVSSTLTILELKGLAQMVGHMQYSLVTR